MGYRCEHFLLQELVGPELFKARGERCWEMLDVNLLRTIDLLRKRYGPIVVNNWHAGGAFTESGLRDFNTTTGAAFSMHKLGRAADGKPKGIGPKEMEIDIMRRPADFPQLTCIENTKITKTWIHIDTRNHMQPQQIWIVNP